MKFEVNVLAASGMDFPIRTGGWLWADFRKVRFPAMDRMRKSFKMFFETRIETGLETGRFRVL
jgi:hypothetical protein